MIDYYFNVFVHLLAPSALKMVHNKCVCSAGYVVECEYAFKISAKKGLYYGYLQSYQKEGKPYLISRF